MIKKTKENLLNSNILRILWIFYHFIDNFFSFSVSSAWQYLHRFHCLPFAKVCLENRNKRTKKEEKKSDKKKKNFFLSLRIKFKIKSNKKGTITTPYHTIRYDKPIFSLVVCLTLTTECVFRWKPKNCYCYSAVTDKILCVHNKLNETKR